MPTLSLYWHAFAAILVFGLAQAQNNGITLTPNNSAIGASAPVSPSFAGMGIEPSNLYSFTGGEYDPNSLSINLLANLANYTGVPPHLRIGGNTQDNMVYDPNFDRYIVYLNPRPTGQGNIPTDVFKFGPSYLKALDRFPVGTPITYGLSLAYNSPDYISRIVAEANATRNLLKQTVLVSFEIGNEPDLYLQNGFRTGAWDSTVYSREWLDRAAAVYDQVLKPYNISANFFEPGATASTIGTSFQISQLANTGILNPAADANNVTFVSAWNQHDYYYYINISSYNLVLDDMMDLSTTPLQFAAWVGQLQQAQATNIPYVLREMASVGPVGQAGISDVFGATLWTLNFFLYTASLNVSSVQMHMTDNSFASPWLPIPMYGTEPFVRTTYYAWAAMAQLIGGSCTTQVQTVPITAFPQNYANRLGVYATYRSSALSALVVLNTKMSNISVTNKGSVPVTFNLPQHAGETLYLSYLTASGADAQSNTTWNNISFERSGSGKPTPASDGLPSTAQVDSTGQVTINVRDTQAVVAAFGQTIGTGPGASVNQVACQALGQRLGQPSAYYSPAHASSIVAAPSSKPEPSTSSTTNNKPTASSSSPSSSTSGPDTSTNGAKETGSARPSINYSLAWMLTAGIIGVLLSNLF